MILIRTQYRLISFLIILAIIIYFPACDDSNNAAVDNQRDDSSFPVPKIDFSPKQYVCYKIDDRIRIDGKLNESDWSKTDWTEYFIDIEGDLKPAPRYKTRVKMLWDSTYFYFAAAMEEPDVWAKLKKRDSIIFYDNDFEIFIDPDGDTHQYYELEVNAFATEWDLFLVKPYRDGGPALHSWDIQELKTAVSIDGTRNLPGDTDQGWTLEIAIPWDVLRECAHQDCPPKDSDQWRVNFSRVEWKTEVVGGRYKKLIDPDTEKPFAEDNWVWSPQGLINMHYPEMWGFVQFSEKVVGTDKVSFKQKAGEDIKWALRQVYYAQQNYYKKHGIYSDSFDKLDIDIKRVKACSWPPDIETISTSFTASIELNKDNSRWYISSDGRVWNQK